jgi:hypothetical protein
MRRPVGRASERAHPGGFDLTRQNAQDGGARHLPVPARNGRPR